MPRRVHYGVWLIRLFAWDGTLPLIVLLVPTVIKAFFPNRVGVIELVAIGLPIAAFCLRFYVGKRHINSNGCGKHLRWLQIASLCAGILVLAFVDCFVLLTHIMPKDAISASDWAMMAALIGIYFLCMAVAMFPGRMETSLVEPPFNLSDFHTNGHQS